MCVFMEKYEKDSSACNYRIPCFPGDLTSGLSWIQLFKVLIDGCKYVSWKYTEKRTNESQILSCIIVDGVSLILIMNVSI